MKLISQIKKDMEFNTNLYNLIEVLKEIAISQYRTFEKKIKTFDKIFFALKDIFGMFDAASTSHPLINTAERKPGIIAVTSDSGLLGGLNMQIMTMALKEVQAHDARLIIIGEKGQAYAKERGISYDVFPGIKEETRLEQAVALRDFIFSEEMKKALGAVKVIYPYSFSLFSQQIHSLDILPYKPEDSGAAVNPIPSELITFESSLDDIAGYLVYLLLGRKFFEIFGFSRLAELSARFMHLESSKSKIEQLNKTLKLQYFRQRHELIDRNIREIFAARMVFK